MRFEAKAGILGQGGWVQIRFRKFVWLMIKGFVESDPYVLKVNGRRI
jgi:hypothetical protein